MSIKMQNSVLKFLLLQKESASFAFKRVRSISTLGAGGVFGKDCESPTTPNKQINATILGNLMAKNEKLTQGNYLNCIVLKINFGRI
jgi:hypothetical protein